MTDKKIAKAVEILKKYEPPEGYYVALILEGQLWSCCNDNQP